MRFIFAPIGIVAGYGFEGDRETIKLMMETLKKRREQER